MKRLGWVDGRNIRFVRSRALPGTADSKADIERFSRMPVEVMVTSTHLSLLTAAASTRTIPIVGLLNLPVEEGFAKTLSRPAGNVTGVTTTFADVYGKCLQLLKEAVPRAKTVALLRGGEGEVEKIDPERLPPDAELPALKAAARALNLRLVRAPLALDAIRAADARVIEAVIAAASRLGAEAMVVPDLVFMTIPDPAKRFHEICLRHRMPAIHMHLVAETGGLLAFGVSQATAAARLAHYVDKVLRGTKPADLPIEQVDRRELHVNLKTAGELGLSIPRSLLLQADRVFQ